MGLVDYVCKEAVCTKLEAADRDAAIRALLERLVAGKAIAEDAVEPAMAALLKREQLGSTAIGKGVAVPHARMESLDGIVVGVGYCGSGIEFNALDGGPVSHVFLVLGSDDSKEDYVAVMQRISKLVQNDDFLRFAEDAGDADSLIALIDEMDS
jgi:PTS system fructose-specific IIA component/PTS system nitrogen regulatory IIA component